MLFLTMWMISAEMAKIPFKPQVVKRTAGDKPAPIELDSYDEPKQVKA